MNLTWAEAVKSYQKVYQGDPEVYKSQVKKWSNNRLIVVQTCSNVVKKWSKVHKKFLYLRNVRTDFIYTKVFPVGFFSFAYKERKKETDRYISDSIV